MQNTPEQNGFPPKQKYFKTARAKIACAHFKAGDIVAVRWTGQQGTHGTHWFEIAESQHGKIEHPVAYPEHHLSDFVL